MIVFGGKDDENEKLNDVWILDILTQTWKQVIYAEGALKPTARSGHSAVLFDDKMVVFGGIFEITRELNDTLVFDTSS